MRNFFSQIVFAPRPTVFHRLAALSALVTWVTLLATCFVDVLIFFGWRAGLGVALFTAVGFGLGFLLGVAALIGSWIHGLRGVRRPALIGVVPSVFGLAVVAASVLVSPQRTPEVDAQLTHDAAQLSRGLPQLISEGTQLDLVEARPGRVMVYQYTLTTVSKGDLEIAPFVAQVRPTLVKTYREEPGLRNYRNRGVTMIYRYLDKDGQLIAEIEIGPKDAEPAGAPAK